MLLCQQHLSESRKDNTSPCVYCQNEGYRKILWVLARREGLSLSIPRKDLELIPADAELLQWTEPFFDAVMLKGICKGIDQPDIATKVHDTQEKSSSK